jgi:RNA polymerase sigma-70 factor (ECF subfamily)
LVQIDADVIEACRRGDSDAFERLVNETKRSVYSLVYRIVGNHDDAADVTQEVYLKVWRQLRSFRGEAAFGTWLWRVASNQAISHLRHRGRLAEPVEPERLMAWEAPAAATPVDTGEVERALARLPAAYRTVLVLREMYDMPMEEVAAQMKATVGATKVRLHRARNRLAAELASDGVVVPLRRPETS